MQEQKRPMLALPMGQKDWESGRRWQFLESCRPTLERLGWTTGVELKGGKDISPTPDSWVMDCMMKVATVGGRATWHLPNAATKKLHEGVSEELEAMARAARLLKDYGLEAATIHCAPAVSVDPPEGAGLERYNSPIGAKEMLAHIKAQVEPLKQLNELTGGILHIENVDITNFRDKGTKVPTYLALQTGCRKDLWWLKTQAGVAATFDSEHFFCADNLLARSSQSDLGSLPVSRTFVESGPRWQLETLAGYLLEKGRPPFITCETLTLCSFVEMLKPKLFHLGGAVRAVDEWGRIDTHLPSFQYPKAKKALEFELCWTMAHPEVIGAVIEVTGQLEPEKYSEWSPRPYDDEVAKMQTYLTVADEIERIQKEKA